VGKKNPLKERAVLKRRRCMTEDQVRGTLDRTVSSATIFAREKNPDPIESMSCENLKRSRRRVELGYSLKKKDGAAKGL